MRDELSVVITCYQEGELLRRAYESLLRQTDKDFEILIVNDGSSHEPTNQCCRVLENQERLRVIWRKRNGGVAAARNTGCGAINGDIIVPLDADDVLPPKAIEVIRRTFQQAPEADFVFGDYLKQNIEEGNKEIVSCARLASPDGWLEPQLLTGYWWMYGGSPFRKSMWKRIGGYDEKDYETEDVDFWKRAFLAGARGFYTREMIYEWHCSRYGRNQQVPYEKWQFEVAKNIAFFDRFGDGLERRKDLLNYFLKEGEVAVCQRLAWQLLRKGYFPFRVVLLALLPYLIVPLWKWTHHS
ncbi:MAG: glycosyltransferase family 2 protein [Candidatus Omnitrophica bacterium]|nr:glycosyltransferase family 2 protein [Candidatus Omnitrophota bacterium]